MQFVRSAYPGPVGDTPWGTVVNLSRSGAASQPAIAAAPDGTLHVLWWDAAEGEQYARTTNASDTTWTAARGHTRDFWLKQSRY